MANRIVPSLAGLLVLVAGSLAHAGENWPAFRGPTGLGFTDEKNLPLNWDAKDGKNVLWTSPLKGQGHASPVVWGDKVFVCTAYWEPHAPRDTVIPEHHVLCYAVKGGKLLWDTKVPPGRWLRNDFRSGPGGGYAACTPPTDGKFVYCVFSSSVIAAVDFDGKIAWRKEIEPHTFDVTIGSSPILYHDTILMLCAMAKKEDSRVIAYDKSNGEIKWEHKLPQMGYGHATPTVIDVKGSPQLLVMGGGSPMDRALESLDPSDGHSLWWCHGSGESASPAYGDGIVYFDSGRGGPGAAVDPTGMGDVSKTHIKWTVPNIPEGLSSPVIVDKYLYRLHQPGVLKCFGVETGKQIYSHRLEGLTTTWASPVVDPGGRMFFASAGKSYVIQAGPEFKVLAVNDLGDASHPSPAVAHGMIFLVGANNIFCVGQKPGQAQ